MRLFLFGKTECYIKGGQSNIEWFDMFWPLSSFNIPPKGPCGSPVVPNGQPSVPWEFEIKHFTMAWFHYGETRVLFTLRRFKTGGLYISIKTGGDMREAMNFLPENRFTSLIRRLWRLLAFFEGQWVKTPFSEKSSFLDECHKMYNWDQSGHLALIGQRKPNF